MRSRIVVVTFLVAACSSGSGGGGTPSLDGTWIYSNSSGNAGIGATFKSDGTYVVSDLVITSSTSANARVETGTFTASGSTLAMTPKEASCAGPDAVYSLSYSFQGSNLEIAQPTGIVVMQPDTATASNFAITVGCFDNAGNFTAEPLAAVSN